MSARLRNLIIGGAVAAGLAAWAVKPRSFTDRRDNYVPAVPDVWYAHRGLHDAGSGLSPQYVAESGDYVTLARRMAMKAGYGDPLIDAPIAPENSLASFAAACEAGYGIELDIQLTADGRVVVVHDNDLLRVAGDPRRIDELTYDELTCIPLFPGCRPGAEQVEAAAGTADTAGKAAAARDGGVEVAFQHVPLLSDVLRVVAGRVPLIVEYKFADNAVWSPRNDELMEKGDALLEAYDGPYVVESFHPGAMNWYKVHRPEVCRGQLAGGVTIEQDGWKEWVASGLVFDWLSRPDFVAYDWSGGRLPQVRAARAMGATAVSWTVRSTDEFARCDDFFDRHIFEAFVPPRF